MFGHLPIVFDSAALAERDRFAFAREEYGSKALKVELDVPKSTPFRLRMGAATYGEVRVAVIESTPYRVSRTRSLIADGDDNIGLVFPLFGRFGGEQHGRSILLGQGEATTMVSDRIGHLGTVADGAFLTILVSPALIKSYAPDINRIRVGVAVRSSRLGFELIRSYLSTLNRPGADDSPMFREVAGRHLAELAAHTLCGSEPPRRRRPDGEGLRAARAAAAHADMAANFIDPGYDVSACARHLGISVRCLQMTLEAGGTHFSHELKRLRLERARRLLADPANAGLRITEIALDCGFSDISYFNHQFRARFGETPTSARGGA